MDPNTGNLKITCPGTIVFLGVRKCFFWSKWVVQFRYPKRKVNAALFHVQSHYPGRNIFGSRKAVSLQLKGRAVHLACGLKN